MGRKVGRYRKGEDGLDFGGKWLNASGGNVVAEAVNLGKGKRTFGDVDAKAVFGQHSKHLAEMLKMLSTIGTEDKDVV